MRIGVVGHRGYDGLADVIQTLERLAPELGLELSYEPALFDVVDEGIPSADRELHDPSSVEALVTLGGDGTLLRGARLLAGHPAPILGVNLGKLGFLTSCGGGDDETAMRDFVAGRYVAEGRMALAASALDQDGAERRRWFALNDVVLHKGGFARVLRLRVSADGDTIATYAADGIVASTPTGSTAYSLSAGGPVVAPTVESIILTPVSAHTLAIRPLVLPPTAQIRVQAIDGPEELLVTVDGQVGTTFASGETLTVCRAPHPVAIVRFPGTTFFARLRHKLGWGGLQERDWAPGPR
jgi:NAD+ kinase